MLSTMLATPSNLLTLDLTMKGYRRIIGRGRLNFRLEPPMDNTTYATRSPKLSSSGVARILSQVGHGACVHEIRQK